MRRMPFMDVLNAEGISTEAINYQDRTLLDELTLAYEEIGAQSSSEYAKDHRANEGRIEAILKNRFNCNVSVCFGERFPAMRVFDEYHNGILIANEFRDFWAAEQRFVQRYLGQKNTSLRGAVDINTGKLSGLFAELPFTIYMPDAHVNGSYRSPEGISLPPSLRATPSENAAATLHEMGHFFTYCEFFSRTVSTNQALAQASKELDDCYSVSQREVIIARCAADIGLIDVDAAALATTDKKSIIETALVTEAVEKSRTELGVSIYDNTSSEFLADQFAARFGAGRDMMTFSAKSQKLFGDSYSYMSTPAFMANQLFSIFLCVLPWTAWFTLPINLFIIYYGGSGDGKEWVHDAPEARFRRIRADAVNRLKNRYLSEGEKKQTLDDLKGMDEMLDKVKDRREWREVIATTLIPKYRKFRKTKLLQQELEQLASNPLFVRAAELSLMN